MNSPIPLFLSNSLILHFSYSLILHQLYFPLVFTSPYPFYLIFSSPSLSLSYSLILHLSFLHFFISYYLPSLTLLPYSSSSPPIPSFSTSLIPLSLHLLFSSHHYTIPLFLTSHSLILHFSFSLISPILFSPLYYSPVPHLPFLHSPLSLHLLFSSLPYTTPLFLTSHSLILPYLFISYSSLSLILLPYSSPLIPSFSLISSSPILFSPLYYSPTSHSPLLHLLFSSLPYTTPLFLTSHSLILHFSHALISSSPIPFSPLYYSPIPHLLLSVMDSVTTFGAAPSNIGPALALAFSPKSSLSFKEKGWRPRPRLPWSWANLTNSTPEAADESPLQKHCVGPRLNNTSRLLSNINTSQGLEDLRRVRFPSGLPPLCFFLHSALIPDGRPACVLNIPHETRGPIDGLPACRGRLEPTGTDGGSSIRATGCHRRRTRRGRRRQLV
ncbi:hypothetical protein C7M84_010595 [Penaeus vannamei]|uniref:Uncharacterized protein n=1 Tax=Penaeus vannamei TaxID=6689 RepID=A0A3R7MW16_PENVA|nr:hypothetical protein C7M84_010595 [Penaeus vannamei]